MYLFCISDNRNKLLNKNNICKRGDCKKIIRKGGSSTQSVRQTLSIHVSKKRNIYLHEGYTWKVKNGTHDGYSNHGRSIICIWL